ncbi:MAG TPA: epoxide hydrolase [Pyrinomonadaceae bacterium]|nr:epoxide hydrolase [Pyrinomonadaceae bacterium]
MRIRPFSIQVPTSTLSELKTRLAQTRWPDAIADSDWTYGASLEYMKEIVDYWQTHFDWRAQETALNRFPQFHADIDGFNVHFIHERGLGSQPLPLVITHGWPGSFVEMLKLIPQLTDPVSHGAAAEDSFDVIVPSMPGYGFSSPPTEPGMNAFRIAELWVQLMNGLGYSRFGAQGGDWGASVGTCIGLIYPQNLIGLHLNYIPGSFKPFLGSGTRGLSETETKFLQAQESWSQAEGGYGHLQATKPQTLAFGLNDSPAGLAAWIIEKFRDWGDCDGDVERRFSKDELLTNVMIYWTTQTIHSSVRLYYEARKRPLHFKAGEKVRPPCGVARFSKEAPFPPREWVERGYNVQRWTEFPVGGHFAALEEPELLAADIRAFFRPLR